jgi:hypothetical protein
VRCTWCNLVGSPERETCDERRDQRDADQISYPLSAWLHSPLPHNAALRPPSDLPGLAALRA